jgi:hypothetical protein
VRASTENNLPTNEVRIGGEVTLPKRLADDDNRRAVVSLVIERKGAPTQGSDIQKKEQVPGSGCCMNSLGLVCVNEIELSMTKGCYLVEGRNVVL